MKHLLELEHQREERLIIAITDVAGFAKACEGQTDAAMFEELDRHYVVIEDIVERAGGMVVKFMGDASFLIFPPARAAECVDALREIVSETSGMWTAFHPNCDVSARATVGDVVCGPMGSGSSRHFDVISKLVNNLVRMPYDHGAVTLAEPLRKLVEDGGEHR